MAVAIPFRQKLYNIALLSIVINNKEPTAGSDMLHICIDPKPRDSVLWLSVGRPIFSVKSFGVLKMKNQLAKEWSISDVEYFKIDLSIQAPHIKINVLNSMGIDTNVAGFCVFDLRD